MIRQLRQMMIRWQIRSLDEQAASIVDARDHALQQLIRIRRERGLKERELWQHDRLTARDQHAAFELE